MKDKKPGRPIYKRWWFWVLLIVILIIIIAAARGGNNQGYKTASNSPSLSPSQAVLAAPASVSPVSTS